MNSNGAVVIADGSSSSSSSSSSLHAASRCSGASSSPMITAATTGQKILQKRWVCDVCKIKWFLDFREACEHEENCAKAGNNAGNKVRGSSSSSSSSLDRSESTMVVASRVVQSDLISSAESNDESTKSDSDGDDDIVGKGMADDGTSAQQRRQLQLQLQRELKHPRETLSASSSSTGTTAEKKVGGKISTTNSSRILSLRDESTSLSSSQVDLNKKKTKAKKIDKENSRRSETKKTIGDGGGGGGQLASIFFPKTGVRAAPPRGVIDVVSTGKVKSSRKKLKLTTRTKAKEKVISLLRKEDGDADNEGSQPILVPGVKQADYQEHVVAERQHRASALARQEQQQKQPRRNQKKLVASTDESAEDDQEESTSEKPSKRIRPSRKRSGRQQQRDDNDADCYNDNYSLSSEHAEDDEDVEYVATNGRSAPTTITAASRQKNTFLSKKQLAEHHAAEIFARRKREAAEERERQKKREELRQMRRPNKEEELELITKDLGAAPADAVDVYRRNSTAALHISDVVPAMDKTTSDQNRRCGQERKKDMCITAVRFPCPSHVMPNNDTNDDESSEIMTEVPITCSASLRHVRRTPKYQHLKPDMVPSTATEKLLTEHPCGLVADDAHARNIMFDMLSSVFCQIKSESNTGEKVGTNKDEEKQLWVDMFSMTTIPDDVLGTNNKEASIKLMSFVEEWKLRRHKSVQRMGRATFSKGGKKKKRKHGYDSDDSFLDDGDAGLENIFLITGPTGSGKTRLVHAVAEQSDCVVIEINSSEQRSGAALKRAIQETTQSHSSLAMSKKKQHQGISTGRFFGSIASGIEKNNDDDTENDDSDSCFESDEESVKECHSLTIILIDEVDLMFDEDTGFWLALAQVAQKAKCPIVLTANFSPPELRNFRCQSISLKRPLPQECGFKMAHVAKSKSMCFNNDLDPKEKLNRLSLIAEFCHCDIRKILNEMQLFHFSQSRPHARSVRVDMNYFGIHRTECSTPLGAVVDRPIILSIKPKTIPKDRHTLITIIGKNFSSVTFSTQRGTGVLAKLFIGGIDCSHFRIISATEIIAVCPPCTIPKGVSENAIYQDHFSKNIDCLTCKFVEVSVRKKCANGLVLHSSSLLGLENNECPATKNWNIEYDIPLRDEGWGKYLSREDFIRKSISQKEALKSTTIENDSLMLSSDEEEFEKKSAPHAGNDQVQRNEGEKGTVENECEKIVISPQALLDAAIASIGACEETSEFRLSPKDHGENLVEVNKFADDLGRLSDAILLEDSLSTLAIPSLAGSVEGFGSDAPETSSVEASSVAKLCKEKNKKPPSFEALYLSGLNESSFFFGNTDSFVTHPIMRRDRQLLSYSELHSRGLGFLDSSGCSSDEISDNSKSGMEDEETETESSFLKLQTRVRSEDDSLLNPQVSPPLLSLPSLLEQSLGVARNLGFAVDPTPLLRSRSNQIATDALGVMHSAVANCDLWYTGLRHDSSDEAVQMNHVWRRDSILDRPLSLDYLPHLRAIAHYEGRIRGKVEDMMKEEADTRGGRRTRTSRKNIRRHYLDECAGGQDKTIEGKALELADKYMIVE